MWQVQRYVCHIELQLEVLALLTGQLPIELQTKAKLTQPFVVPK